MWPCDCIYVFHFSNKVQCDLRSCTTTSELLRTRCTLYKTLSKRKATLASKPASSSSSNWIHIAGDWQIVCFMNTLFISFSSIFWKTKSSNPLLIPSKTASRAEQISRQVKKMSIALPILVKCTALPAVLQSPNFYGKMMCACAVEKKECYVILFGT